MSAVHASSGQRVQSAGLPSVHVPDQDPRRLSACCAAFSRAAMSLNLNGLAHTRSAQSKPDPTRKRFHSGPEATMPLKGDTDEMIADTPELQIAQRAYDFINESLRNAERSTTEGPTILVFAIANVAQGLELLLKERLRREHPVLVFADVERNRSTTVSFSQALARLQRCGVIIPKEDLTRIQLARDLRNSLVHYVANVSEDQLFAAYVDFFEFAHVFHLEHLGEELHPHISRELWVAEANLIEAFKRDFIEYQGATVITYWPCKIVEAQFWPIVAIEGDEFSRIRYGEEEHWGSDLQPTNCHDCAALPGQLHAEGCDAEICPRCKGQFLTCECGDTALYYTIDSEEE